MARTSNIRRDDNDVHFALDKLAEELFFFIFSPRVDMSLHPDELSWFYFNIINT
jgi:hypothetical protein